MEDGRTWAVRDKGLVKSTGYALTGSEIPERVPCGVWAAADGPERLRSAPSWQQTRQRIVAASAELMFEGGVAATTMEGVRAAEGVSSSHIHHYFTNK
jgi:hypothetical protein